MSKTRSHERQYDCQKCQSYPHSFPLVLHLQDSVPLYVKLPPEQDNLTCQNLDLGRSHLSRRVRCKPFQPLIRERNIFVVHFALVLTLTLVVLVALVPVSIGIIAPATAVVAPDWAA